MSGVWPKICSLCEKVTIRKTLLILGILCILALPVIIHQLGIDWEREIRNYGYLGIFLLTLTSSSTIVFPVPGEVALAAAPAILNLSGVEVFWLGVVASVGGSLGELTGYLVGYWGRAVVRQQHLKGYQRAELWMRRYGSAAIFVFALVPVLIFDLVGIAAGTLRFPLLKFLLACWLGRLIRSIAVVYLGWSLFGLLHDLF